MTAECPYTLQWDAPSALKIAPFHGGIWTPSNTWFPGPTRVLNINGISIGSAVFAGLTSVTQTDRPTDRSRYSVGSNRPHLRTYTVVLQCGRISPLSRAYNYRVGQKNWPVATESIRCSCSLGCSFFFFHRIDWAVSKFVNIHRALDVCRYTTL